MFTALMISVGLFLLDVIVVDCARSPPVAPFGSVLAAVAAAATAVLFVGLCITVGRARDLGQWENTDPAIREWYQSLGSRMRRRQAAAAKQTPIGR
jgi:hypothetical protein